MVFDAIVYFYFEKVVQVNKLWSIKMAGVPRKWMKNINISLGCLAPGW